MIVFAFDRDQTVDVNPHPDHKAVPLEWIAYLSNQTVHKVYATGNQTLKREAGIPGTDEILAHHDLEHEQDSFTPRLKRIRLLHAMFASADAHIVVDDAEKYGDLEAWNHYLPWSMLRGYSYNATRDDSALQSVRGSLKPANKFNGV